MRQKVNTEWYLSRQNGTGGRFGLTGTGALQSIDNACSVVALTNCTFTEFVIWEDGVKLNKARGFEGDVIPAGTLIPFEGVCTQIHFGSGEKILFIREDVRFQYLSLGDK